MKRRLRRIVNFFAFNLLFFALYLNFIHKEKIVTGTPTPRIETTASVVGSVPVNQPEKYLDAKATLPATSVTE